MFLLILVCTNKMNNLKKSIKRLKKCFRVYFKSGEKLYSKLNKICMKKWTIRLGII